MPTLSIFDPREGRVVNVETTPAGIADASRRLAPAGDRCACGSVLSAVTFECVRGQYCPEARKKPKGAR